MAFKLERREDRPATIAEHRALRDEIWRLRMAITPFIQYYDDIRFNLRKQPHPSDAAIEERGERVARVTWAQFHALREALTGEQSPKAQGCSCCGSPDHTKLECAFYKV